MGVVYLAVRDDGTFRKNVALKVLLGSQVSHEFNPALQAGAAGPRARSTIRTLPASSTAAIRPTAVRTM
jgi:hypothetical protein